ncbi:MAG: hypothetical protein A2X86_16950 [Bdellovibrionales bacterium GWA2_49_15]|nr:MAG: hypothetical protein A2X86_16950 [Bdellovibrionales bacterium GWA2_49_15]HAZ12437.1 hypothetical protein [Bdellovibrionales bacterium]
MLIKLGLFVSLLVGCLNFAWAEVPSFPANCFQGKNYCSRSRVTNDQDERRIIRLEIFAQISKAKFANYEELRDLYFRFEDWPTYAARSVSILFTDSARQRGPEPEAATRHFAHYKTRAPWPLSYTEVIDLLEYQMLASTSPEVFAAEFSQVADFTSRKGLKYNTGQLHILDNQADHWLIYFYSDVIPAGEILPRVAAPYILRPMEDILRGMFAL